MFAMSKREPRNRRRRTPRRGVVVVLTALFLVVMFGFVAFSLDSGLISITQQSMQNAVDAASLAASQEIIAAVSEGEGGGLDANSIAIQAARDMAAEVAAANGVYVDPDSDVTFGKRVYDESSQTWDVLWNASPYNVVKVDAHRTGADTSAPNGKLKLAFGWAIGKDSVALETSGIAFVEARDIVVVLDYSGSMNDDSEMKSFGKLGQQAVEDNMEDIWEALGPPPAGSMTFEPQYLTLSDSAGPGEPQVTVTFKDKVVDVSADSDLDRVKLYFEGGGDYQFYSQSGTSGSYSYSNKSIWKVRVRCDGSDYVYFEDTNENVQEAFGLDSISYPYDDGSWYSFVDYVRTSSKVKDAGYKKMYGGQTMVNYLLEKKPRFSQTNELWKTPEYPFQSMKEGMTLFCEFLNDLEFGDELGLVSYATSAVTETGLNDASIPVTVDLGNNLITNDYDAINTIQVHKQAAHYSNTTGLGDGIKEANELLDEHGRYGARPTIFVMTDGNANVSPSSFSLPAEWNWNEVTDYDGDGAADYTTSDRHKQYAIYQAKQAVDAGYTVHTLSVGANSDTDIMEAIAHIGGGVWIDVPGGASVEEMTEQMLDAFNQIAAKVPPPQLVYED